jgi:hypothetical protein
MRIISAVLSAGAVVDVGGADMGVVMAGKIKTGTLMVPGFSQTAGCWLRMGRA